MEWDTGMEPDFDDLLEVICPPVHNNELYDFILDGTCDSFLLIATRYICILAGAYFWLDELSKEV